MKNGEEKRRIKLDELLKSLGLEWQIEEMRENDNLPSEHSGEIKDLDKISA